MTEKIVKQKLESRTVQIEKLMQRHQIDGQVMKGGVQGRRTHFDISAKLEDAYGQFRSFVTDFKQLIGRSDIRLERVGELFRLNVTEADVPVRLLDLLKETTPSKALSVPIGLNEAGIEVVLTFEQAAVTHMLVSGAKASGKSSFIRSLAAGLAYSAKQSEAQLVVMSPSAESRRVNHLRPLNYLPHMIFPVFQDVEAAVLCLNQLADEAAYRLMNKRDKPAIIVFIDRLDFLLDEGGRPAYQALSRLLADGIPAGVHVVAAVENPKQPLLDNLMMAYFSMRVVGNVDSAETARIAAGARHTEAEKFESTGEFVAVVRDEFVYFQAAYLSDDDLNWVLRSLEHQKKPRILAKPIFSTGVAMPEQLSQEAQYFVVNPFGEVVFAEDDGVQN